MRKQQRENEFITVCPHQVKVKWCPAAVVQTERVVGELSHRLAHGSTGILSAEEPPALFTIRASIMLGVAVYFQQIATSHLN